MNSKNEMNCLTGVASSRSLKGFKPGPWGPCAVSVELVEVVLFDLSVILFSHSPVPGHHCNFIL